MKRVFKFFLALSAIGIVIAGATAYWAWTWLSTANSVPESHRVVTVEQGMTLSVLSRELASTGLIAHPRVWLLYARVSGQTRLKAGEFALAPRLSPREILTILLKASEIQYRVTLVEGSSFEEFLTELHRQPKLLKKIQAEDALDVLAEAGIELDHPEGWFYPDTYQYVLGDSDLAILKRAHKKMREKLTYLWDTRDNDLPYRNAYEALIMASIVEKETGAAEEREKIAGVFVRRLNKNMRLQTDPTVIYGMGKNYTGNITRTDLRTPTPYNTYLIRGLPPTPIAMPGSASIHAALHPAEGKALYFVAQGDGRHYFSETLDEHNAAVARYQKRRVKNYRSRPAPTSTPGATP